MITKEQLHTFAKENKTNETVVFREYLQLLFLKDLYAQTQSKYIFFKGGTALHLIYKMPRFSEDLDFTVAMEEKKFLEFIQKLFTAISKNEPLSFKEKKSIAGKRFLLTAESPLLYKTFVNLDFSFGEKVLQPQRSFIETRFPVIFTSYIWHLSKEEIFAEKIRAILTRTQGRDLYDLWFLLSQGVSLNQDLVREKLKYYHLEKIDKEEIIKKIKKFPPKKFVMDIRPLVPVNERKKLESFLNYVQEYLEKKLDF